VSPLPEVNTDNRLSDLHHEFLVRVFDPLVPSSLHQLTVRYNIPSRLWQSGFHLILERLRHAWMSNQPAALDLLTDLVYDAYKFYTDLLEARYRMAIASHQASDSKPRQTRPDLKDLDGEAESSGASIGAEVAQAWDVEDKETWRTTARDWYSMGITEKPGEGRLHHHLALLSRDIRGQEPRALHHFTKS
jgi:protein SMG6